MPNLDLCDSTEVNDVASSDKANIIYYAQNEESLYVTTENGGTLQVINLNAAPVLSVNIVEKNSVIHLDTLPNGNYVVLLNNVSLKIAK